MAKPKQEPMGWGAVRVTWFPSDDKTHWISTEGETRTNEEMERMSKNTFDRFTVTDPATGKDVTQEFLDKIPHGVKNRMNFIQNIGMKKGALHAQLGIPKKKKIPMKTLMAAAKKGGTLGRRARLAITLEHLHH